MKQEEEDIEVDMSPMIDMVFLLLIFFIVASQIIDEKPDVVIPAAVYAKVPEDTTGRLMISVRDDETYYVEQQEVSLEELKTQLGAAIEADTFK